MLLNWTGKTGKNGFVEFLFSSDGFFFIPILTSYSCVCRFASIFFLKHFLKARLLHILWTRNHLIRVFAFSQWHFASSFADSDGKFGSYFSLSYFLEILVSCFTLVLSNVWMVFSYFIRIHFGFSFQLCYSMIESIWNAIWHVGKMENVDWS